MQSASLVFSLLQKPSFSINEVEAIWASDFVSRSPITPELIHQGLGLFLTLYDRSASSKQEAAVAYLCCCLGDLYRLAQRCALAIEWYNRALQLNPRDGRVYAQLAVAMEQSQVGSPFEWAYWHCQSAVAAAPYSPAKGNLHVFWGRFAPFLLLEANLSQLIGSEQLEKAAVALCLLITYAGRRECCGVLQRLLGQDNGAAAAVERLLRKENRVRLLRQLLRKGRKNKTVSFNKQ